MTSILVTTHEDYKDTIKAVEQVRDCVEGAPRVKKRKATYLPSPSQVDPSTTNQRYLDYILNAEFDNDTDDTRRELIGKMRLDDAIIELPDKLNVMVDDIDNDGTGMKASMELAINNILQVKFQLLVADYQGLSGVDLESLSLADAKELDPRTTVKQYTRENIVNWHFTRTDGAMQLSWVMLLERGSTFNSDSFVREDVESYLILGIDDTGYYQQKITYGGSKAAKTGDREYITVNGKSLKFIPCEIVADEELEAGSLPRAMGYLYNISEKVLQRYRLSALYKECMKALQPTTYTKGWRTGDKELFEEVNGRSNVESGPYSMNGLPSNVEVSIESAQNDLRAFEHYIAQSKKQVSEMGGKSGAQSSNMTATEANIIASDQNALLDTVATSAENGFTKVLGYCAMFEGLVTPEEVHQYEGVVVSLPRDFGTPKMSVEEVKVLLELRTAGARTMEQVVTQLADGGWDYQDAQDTINELENDGGNLMLPPVDEG